MEKIIPKIFIILLFTLTLSEFFLRIIGYADRYFYGPIYAPLDDNSNVPYIHKPNLVNAKSRSNTIFDTDSLGLRTNGSERLGGDSIKIIVLGDSFAFGQGVFSNETFSSVLEKDLRNKDLAVDVYNLGVSGYSVKDMISLLRERSDEIKPDFIIMTIIGEDFDLNRAGVLDKYGYTQTTNSFSKNSYLKLILRKFAFSYFVRDLYLSLKFPGYANRIRSLNIDFGKGYSYIQELPVIAEELNSKYILVLLPSKADTQQFEIISPRLQQDGINTLDLQFISEKYSDQEFCLNHFDCHPSALVHNDIAKNISLYLGSIINSDNSENNEKP